MRRDYALSPAEKMDARSALRMIEGRGLTLTDCARLALSMHGVTAGSSRTLLSVASDRFLQSVLARGRRASTFTFYEQKLIPFIKAHGDAVMGDVTRPALKKWIEGLDVGPTYKAMIFRSVRAMYRWARRQDPPLTSQDPTEGLVLDVPVIRHEKKFFSVKDCEHILTNIAQDFLPMAALALFAGIRPEELAPVEPTKARLHWEHLQIAKKMIRVPADVSKTDNPRIIEGLPPTLWAWLKGRTKESGPIYPGSYKTAHNALRAAYGAKREWIDDGPRHTFASYMLAFTSDAGKVSHWLGHEGKTTLIHTTYAGLTDLRTARKFVALRPTSAA